jgi:GNAT superfamily N-acetyltransferase
MSEEIAFRMNTASEAQIADHLLRCDAGFVPPLSSRVEIGGYAHKISTRATRFEAWDRALVGLLAAYCNDAGRRGAAYITSVSVLEGWRGRGVALRLLEQCIDHARKLGFRCVELEVDGANAGAVGLYGKSGFKIDRAQGQTVIMRLDFSKDA